MVFFSKIDKSFKSGLLVAFVAVSGPVYGESAQPSDIDIDIDNNGDVVEWVSGQAESFLNNYQPTIPEVLQKYDSCTPPGDMSITVNNVVEKVIYDYDGYSSIDLTNKFTGASGNNTGEKQVIGLTGRAIGIDLNRGLQIKKISPNYACLWIKSVDITATLKQRVIISNQYRSYECEQDRILQHENKHVFFNRAVFQEYHNISKRFYEKSLTPVRGVKIPTDTNDSEYMRIITGLDNYMLETADKIYKNMKQTASILNGIIDTEVAYDDYNSNTARICGQTGPKS